MTTEAFHLLNPSVQEWLYNQGWTSLHQIQADAIGLMHDTNNDIIISARTASGKTEAAFLPIVSQIANDYEGSIRAIYVGPLKALINDQFRRIEELCVALDIPVHRWHGDVGQAERKRLSKNPAGILLITPESIESLLINRSQLVGTFFKKLQYIVIDELHMFLGEARGTHLRCLLGRVQHLRGHTVRRIGLSATMGDIHAAARWMRPGSEVDVSILEDPSADRTLRTGIFGFTEPGPKPTKDQQDPPEGGLTHSIAEQIFTDAAQGVTLVFGNAKRDIEIMATTVEAIAHREKYPDDYVLVHHGSLSRNHRVDVEERVQNGMPHICFCSATLELGIDIGDIQAVGHIAAPWTVSSTAQRLGRSGRRGDAPSVFRQYISVRSPNEDIEAIDPTYLEEGLLRAIAVIELFLEGWTEPPSLTHRHWPVMGHQLLSMVAQHQSINPKDLFALIRLSDGYPDVDINVYKDILSWLGQHQYLMQLENGDLLLGADGEHIVGNKDWYAVFSSPEEWEVFHGGYKVGSIPVINTFSIGDRFVLAGKSWQVIDLDTSRQEITVEHAIGFKPPIFTGEGGAIHDRVASHMRRILERTDCPPFLDAVAAAALGRARQHYRHYGLKSVALTETKSGLFLWVWRGSTWTQTAGFLLLAAGAGQVVQSPGFGLAWDGTWPSAQTALTRAANLSADDLVTWMRDHSAGVFGKWSELIPPAVMIESLVKDTLAIDAVQQDLLKIVKSLPA